MREVFQEIVIGYDFMNCAACFQLDCFRKIIVNLSIRQFQFMTDEVIECITDWGNIFCRISDINHLWKLSFTEFHIAAFIWRSESQEIIVVLLSVSVLNNIIVYLRLLSKLSKTKWASWLQTAEKGLVEKLNRFHMCVCVCFLEYLLLVFGFGYLSLDFS